MTITREFTKEQLIERCNKAIASLNPCSGTAERQSLACFEIALASLEAEASLVMPAELHPDTRKLVTDFCTALAEKLYKAQLKYGYDADWKQDGWPTQCQAHFHQHIAKGDPRDVAAYCAFMWYHGWKTEATPPAPVVPDFDALRLAFEETERESDHGFNLHKYGIGYADDATQARWESWVACRAAMQGKADSPVIPGCSCRTCRPVTMTDMRFVVCPDCGNKRCPHTNDHRNSCTRSNEPGQKGSAYPAAPQQEDSF